MKVSARIYLEQYPEVFEKLSSISLDYLLLPRILETMFQSPLTAGDLPNFRKGRENERTMALELPRILEEMSEHRYRVLRMAETGLVSTSSAIQFFAATSPDLVLTIEDTSTQ